MMKCYIRGKCDLQVVRKFYEIYPQGLQECSEDVCGGSYPLSISLAGWVAPDPDLFIWMAQQNPEAVHQTFYHNFTILHETCSSLSTNEHQNELIPFKCTPNMAKICRFLISEHPGLVCQELRGHGYLPIHMLAHCCNRPIVQEIAVLLLKEYPECVHVKAGSDHPELAMVPFVQQVHPLIVEELEIDKEILQLTQMSKNMAEAAISSKSRFTSTSALEGSTLTSALFGPFSEVFVAWANLRVCDVLPAAKQRVQERIAETCRNLEADDVFDESSSEEEHDWDGDSSSDESRNEETDHSSSDAED